MSRTARLVVLTVAVGLAGATSAARAGQSKEDEAFQKRLFGRVLDDKQIHACFSRAYDAGHLAQHPRQNVRTMLLLVSAKSEIDSGPSYELRISVTFRRSGVHFESAGDCGSIHDAADAGGSAEVAHCGVDCDGGSLDVAIKNEKSVLVSIPEGARLWRAGGDDDSGSDGRKRFGADDKVFRLDKVALTECLRLAVDNREKASMRRGQ
jgi:hypothetical protein